MSTSTGSDFSMGTMEECVTYVSTGVAKRDPTVIGILVAVAVVLLTTIFLIIRSRSKAQRRTILITGICDAGKTSLFTRLVHDTSKMTFTSIKVNKDSYNPPGNNKSLQVVDIPGHDKLRHKAMEEHKNAAKAILFVIDSVTAQKEIKEVAECLYMVLTDPVVSKNRLPLLIICNKQDQSLARGVKVIQPLLEKEITTLRMTRSAALEATDGSAYNNNVFLGIQGKNFDFADLRGNKVTFAECNTTDKNQEADLLQVTEWLAKIA